MVHPTKDPNNFENKDPSDPDNTNNTISSSATSNMPKKKVEWSSNLSSVESLAPAEDRSPMWDSETDHLLSYFLGGDGNGMVSPPTAQLQQQQPNNHAHRYATSTSGAPSISGAQAQDPNSHRQQGGNSSNNQSMSKASALRPPPSNGILLRHPSVVGPNLHRPTNSQTEDNDYDDDDDEPVPPPTPAIQYYHPSTSSSSVSSSFSSKGSNAKSNTTTLKPPMFPTNSLLANSSMRNNNRKPNANDGSDNNATSMDDMSPISPAAMITASEPLMLPPPNNTPPHSHSQSASGADGADGRMPLSMSNNTSSSNPAMAPAPPNARQSHLDWLQQINAMAKQASQQQQQQQQQQAIPSSATSASTTAAPVTSQQPQLPNTSATNGGMPSYPMQFFPMYYHTQAALSQLQQQTPQESEEKRARRLERNRESARKSRRRKKERLSGLEEQVNKLYTKLETERTQHLQSMATKLDVFQTQRVVATSTNPTTAALADIWHGVGPNCPVRRVVIDYQYSTLERSLCPKYQKFVLWLTLHQESYFAAGKEHHMAENGGKQLLRVASGKISSKQVGDELTNGPKLEDGSGKPRKKTKPKNGDIPQQTASAFDALRMWPLLCFELSISVDQEDRMLQAMKKMKKREHLQRDRSQIAAATRMASSMKEAILYQSHVVNERAKKTYLEILTPEQTATYYKWLSTKPNRERCQSFVSCNGPASPGLDRQGEEQPQKKGDTMDDGTKDGDDGAPPTDTDSASKKSTDISCLMDLCKKLEEVLKISKIHHSTAAVTPTVATAMTE